MTNISIDTGNNGNNGNNKGLWGLLLIVVGGITTVIVTRRKKKEEVKATEQKNECNYQYHVKTKLFDWELEKMKKEYNEQAEKDKNENVSQQDEKPITWFGLTVEEVEKKYGKIEETTLGDAISRSEEAVCYVPYTLYERSTTLIAGETGGGKTTLLYQMLLDLVNQRASTLFPALSMDIPKFTITPILLDSENLNKNGALKDRYPSSATPGLEKIQYIGGPYFESVDAFKQYCWERYQSLKPGDRVVLCLDNATIFGKALSSNQVTSLSKYFTSSIMFAYEHNIRLTYVLVLHVNKDKTDTKSLDVNNLSGSSYFGYLADNVIILGNTSVGENDKYLKIEKSRIDQKPDGVFHLLRVQKDKENDYLHFENLGQEKLEDLLSKSEGKRAKVVRDIGAKEKPLKQRIEELARQTDPKLTQQEIADILGVTRTTVNTNFPTDLKRKKKK